MKYLTTSEIENTYNVSRPTIGKWIEDAMNKNNDLHVGRVDTRIKVIDSPHNREILTQLATAALKYKPKSEVRRTSPKKELYELYSEEQISSIYFDLLYKREINLKNVYIGEGEKAWDQYYFSEGNEIKDKDQELLERVLSDLEVWFADNSKINVVDLGPGNGHPIRKVLDFFSNKKMLNKYIPIDISQQILDTTVENVKSWYPKLEVKPYVRDFELNRFSDIFLPNKDINRQDSNVVFIMGGTFNNVDDRLPLFKNLSSSFTEEDYFVVLYTTDAPKNRAKVSYVNEGYVLHLWKWITTLLGMEYNPKNLEGNYDSESERNEMSFVLDKDYEIEFTVGGQKLKVNLMKNEKIVLWWHYLIGLIKITSDAQKAGLSLIEHKLDTSGTIGLAMFKKEK
jgi:uncharacterized SAM-dependent methyltransferase